jgi:hypothetical protein
MLPRKPASFLELRAVILRMYDDITENMCRRVITNMGISVYEVVRQDSGHIEHGIRKIVNFHESFFVFIGRYVALLEY